MTITSTGIVFLFLAILSLRKFDYLIFLVFLASVFQSASLVNIAGSGVPIYAFVQIVLLVFVLTRFILNDRKLVINKYNSVQLLLFLFFVVSLIGAVILPRIFEGLPVFNPRAGIDAQYGDGNQTPLLFSIGNVAQPIYLFLNIAVFFIVSNYVQKTNFNKVRNLLVIMLCIAIFFSLYQFSSNIFGHSSIIDDFLYNNVSYDIGNMQNISSMHRINGSFSEPSIAGSFFAAFTCALLFYKGRSRKLYFYIFIISLISLLLSTSSTGYLTLIISFFVFSGIRVLQMLHQHNYQVSVILLAKIFVPLIGLIVVSVIFWNNIISLIDSILVLKGNSDSFLHRLFADRYAFKIFVDTYGLGAGLGSTRPSSFIPYLLSNVGFLGITLLFFVIYTIMKNAYKKLYDENIVFVFILFMGILISMLIAIPDISYPYFWLFLAVLFGLSKTNSQPVVIRK